jgi:Arm DNA-binding domain
MRFDGVGYFVHSYDFVAEMSVDKFHCLRLNLIAMLLFCVQMLATQRLGARENGQQPTNQNRYEGHRSDAAKLDPVGRSNQRLCGATQFSDIITFSVVYRTRDGIQRWQKIGRFGVWTPAQARIEAQRILRARDLGEDPSG